MTKAKLNAAVKKHSAVSYETRDALISALESDPADYSKDDIEDILFALQNGSNDKPAEDNKIDLSEFDYKNLVGDSFRKYIGIVGDRAYTDFNKDTGTEIKGVNGTMKLEEMAVFCLYRVDVVRVQRFPGMKDTPIDFRGVKVKDEKPVHTTKIPVRIALENNAQIENAHSIAGHGKYYLLKK